MKTHLLAIAALIATLLVALPSCATTLSTAQAALTSYSFHVEGAAEGVLAANSTYLAVDASVDLEATYRAPQALGGAPEVVWRKTFTRGSGKRAYRVLFSSAEGQDFVRVIRVSWEEARIAMPFLPPDTGGGGFVPEESADVLIAQAD